MTDSTARPIVFLLLSILAIAMAILCSFFVGGLVLLLAGVVARLAVGTVPDLLVFSFRNLLLFTAAYMLIRMLFFRYE